MKVSSTSDSAWPLVGAQTPWMLNDQRQTSLAKSKLSSLGFCLGAGRGARAVIGRYICLLLIKIGEHISTSLIYSILLATLFKIWHPCRGGSEG